MLSLARSEQRFINRQGLDKETHFILPSLSFYLSGKVSPDV